MRLVWVNTPVGLTPMYKSDIEIKAVAACPEDLDMLQYLKVDLTLKGFRLNIAVSPTIYLTKKGYDAIEVEITTTITGLHATHDRLRVLETAMFRLLYNLVLAGEASFQEEHPTLEKYYILNETAPINGHLINL